MEEKKEPKKQSFLSSLSDFATMLSLFLTLSVVVGFGFCVGCRLFVMTGLWHETSNR